LPYIMRRPYKDHGQLGNSIVFFSPLNGNNRITSTKIETIEVYSGEEKIKKLRHISVINAKQNYCNRFLRLHKGTFSNAKAYSTVDAG